MAGITIYLPHPPKINESGNFAKSMEKYFKTLGSMLAQMKMQASLAEGECGKEFIEKILLIEKIIDEVMGITMSDVFTKMKNKVHEMEYKVREFLKDIDVWIQKKIIEAAVKLLSLFGIPNPLELPIPFLGSAMIPDKDGNLYRYTPKIKDFFTKDGKEKIKAALRDKLDQISDFFDDVKDFFSGKINVNSPDHRTEELWQRVQHEINKILNNAILALINALFGLLKKIPIIGSLIAPFLDPTLTLDQIYKNLHDAAVKQYNTIMDKIKSGELEAEIALKLKQEADKILDGLINSILNIPIPLFGTVGSVLGILTVEEEGKRYKIASKEKLLARIRDGWNNLIEKIRRFFMTGWVKVMYDLIMKLPGIILKMFPILKDIIAWCELIMDVISGKIDGAKVARIILSAVFNLADQVINALSGGCIDIVFTEYGYLPDMTEEDKKGTSGPTSDKEDSTKCEYTPPAPPGGDVSTQTDKDGNITGFTSSKTTISEVKTDKDGMITSYTETDNGSGKQTTNTVANAGTNNAVIITVDVPGT